MELSVVIPTLGRAATLARVLTALERQAGACEVIVAADAAETELDAVDAALDGRPYPARRVQGTRRGASSARNAGWRAATAPVVLFLDDDVVPGRDLLARHRARHAEHPEDTLGVLGHVAWAEELHITPFMRWLDRNIQFAYGTIDGTRAGWGHFYTANVSVKRAILERAGGFDEVNLPFGYEDLDLGLRLERDHGLRLHYDAAARAEHLHAMTLAGWEGRIGRIARSERAFVALHPDQAPYFHDRLSEALLWPPLHGRGARLARWVPRRTPWLGPYVWTRADVYWRQRLAAPFLAAWEDSGS